jgi:hypothetical protein
MKKFTVSTKVSAILGTLLICFISSLFSQPVALHWLAAHPWYDAVAAALASSYHLWNTLTPAYQDGK